MTAPSLPEIHPIVRRIASVAGHALSEAERAALTALPMQAAEFDAHQDIVRERDRPTRCFAVLSGITGVFKSLQTGERLVTAYHVAGDVPDFQSLHLDVLDFGIAAVTRCRIAFVRHDDLRALLKAQPALVHAFWRANLIDASLCRQWMLNNGRRPAYARLAHLLCELYTRLDAVELVQGGSCALPITQPEIGDALGITPVHVNRILQKLRASGLITLGGGRLTVHDWDGLADAGEFDPAYLHIRRKAA